jgi:dipeptidyl aminopeptidase/acylaminoacyl peptidase
VDGPDNGAVFFRTMKMQRRVLLLLLASLAASSLSAAGRRPITEKDLLAFRWIADPRISADGGRIAYVLVTANEKEDRYDTSLWLIDARPGASPRRLTAGPRDSSPRWSPDGRALAFLRAGEKEPPQIHVLSMGGGEPRKLTDLPKGASPAAWSPDGKTIAFTSSTTPEDLEEQKKNAGKSEAEKEKKSDVRVVTRALYRDNDEGLLDLAAHEHVWTVPFVRESDGVAAARAITSGRFDEGGPFWSPDGARIYFVSDRQEEPYYKPADSNLYAVPAAGGVPETVIDIDGPVFGGGVAPSPDGRSFAFEGWINPAQERSYTQVDLFVARGGKPENLTSDYDSDIGNDIIGDQHPPRGGGSGRPLWTGDGSGVIPSTTEHGRSNLVRVDVASHRVEPLTTGDHEIVSYTATPDGARMAVTIGDATISPSSPLRAREPRPDGSPTRTTRSERARPVGAGRDHLPELRQPANRGLGREAPIRSEEVSVDPQHPRRPHTAYGETFFHEFQWMAAKGYVVLAPNPREAHRTARSSAT